MDEDDIITIENLKPGQKFTLDMGLREVIFTKLEEPKKFTMEDWFDDEVEIYIMEDKIEEDEPLHYAFENMTLEEGLKKNEGKFGKNLIMYDFIGRVVEGIEMEEEEEEAEEEQEQEQEQEQKQEQEQEQEAKAETNTEIKKQEQKKEEVKAEVAKNSENNDTAK